MSRLNRKGLIVSQNTGLDDGAFQPGIAQPISQNEIEDLIYADDRPTSERLERLREIREEVGVRASIDYVAKDLMVLQAELDKAIEQLEARHSDGSTPEHDPLEHREALSPDSDEYEALAEEEKTYQQEAGEAGSWDDSDEVGPDRR